MKMKCRQCDNEMDLWEFLTYAQAYLLKIIIPAAVPFIIAAISHKLSTATETKGFIDSTMAGLANNFSIACPQCKKADSPWGPDPEPEQSTEPKKMNAISENT